MTGRIPTSSRVLHATYGTGGKGKNNGTGSKSGAGLGAGYGGKGIGLKRHRKIIRDNIRGVTKPAIRRLARRGGVKRISAQIYDDARSALKKRLEVILQEVVQIVAMCNRKTVVIGDVIFVLRRLGSPIYGFGDVRKLKD